VEAALRGVRVADVMNPSPLTVPITVSLDELVHDYLEPHHLHAAPVAVSNQFLGLVSLTDVRRVPEEQWGDLPAGHVMVPIERIQAVSPDEPLSEVLSLMATTQVHQVPVMQGWHLVGMLSRAAIVRYLATRRGLSPAEAEQDVSSEIEMLQHAG
ncbi:MAG TPA: CBS domain-containing protein, partial [Ktedonobacterales bacterium]|nr:CBS domain-containing protein [Ktedonobacterales bacterium]